MATRGKNAPVNRWWLRLARERVQKEPSKLGDLGKHLADLIGRATPWKHTTLSNFKAGKEPVTLELAEALCKHYRLPPPVAFPRSYNEAIEIMAVIEKYDGLIAANDDDARPESEQAEVVPMPRKPRARKTAPRQDAITIAEWDRRQAANSKKSV